MSPQLVDFDADGRDDMVMGTFEGVAFVVPGTEAGFGEPERILDAQGRHVLLSQFWNRETKEWDETDRSPRGRRNPDDHCISVVAFDWDDDGDLDLLLGAKEGRLYLQRNEGKPGAPSFTGVNEPLDGFEVPGGLTAPRLVDWDGDGLTDLLCGSFDDGVFLYRNAGARGAPSFGPPVALVEPPAVELPQEPLGPASGFYAEAVDYDGDGDLDLLVGGESKWQREGRALTEEERRRAEELEAEIEALDTEFRLLYQDEPQSEEDEVERTAKGRALREKIADKTELLDELVPQEKEASFVWLYRRIGGAGAPAPEVPLDKPTEEAPVRSGMVIEREGDTLRVAVRLLYRTDCVWGG